MQMHKVQSELDKVTVSGWAEGGHGILTATCHPNELTIAKEILKTLYRVMQTSWSVEFHNDRINFWCSLHDTYGCRLSRNDLGKGLRNVRARGQELIARIQGGCAG